MATIIRRKFLSWGSIGAASMFGVHQNIPLFSPIGKRNLGLESDTNKLPENFPSQDIQSVQEIVLVSHGQYEKVKEIVTKRPELAKASYDWGFGDWESALGAASHTGSQDIAKLLIEHGARPNIFTFTMMGEVAAVKSLIEATPGIQRIHGPHGITLLQHAKVRLQREDISSEDANKVKEVIEYLEFVEGSDEPAKALTISEEQKKTYLGEYRFGDGEEDYFEVGLNRSGKLFIAKGTTDFGRVLNRVGEHLFAPSGAPHVRIQFETNNGMVSSVTVLDPTPLVTAMRK